jgi:hypothetical protein
MRCELALLAMSNRLAMHLPSASGAPTLAWRALSNSTCTTCPTIFVMKAVIEASSTRKIYTLKLDPKNLQVPQPS